MDPVLVGTIAQYGPWGVSAALLIMNWFVIQKLFESLERMNKLLSEEIAGLAAKLDQRRCMLEREASNDHGH